MRSVSEARDTRSHRGGALPAVTRAFSELHGFTPRGGRPRGVARSGPRWHAGLALPAGLDALLGSVAGADAERLKAEYSGLFEVGSQGPPVPIREDLMHRPEGRYARGPRALLRLLRLPARRPLRLGAGPPVRRAGVHAFPVFPRGHASPRTGLSWQLAQADFAERHLHNWVPQLAAGRGAAGAGLLLQPRAAGVAGLRGRSTSPGRRSTIVYESVKK